MPLTDQYITHPHGLAGECCQLHEQGELERTRILELIHNQKIQFAAESFAHMRLVTQEMKRALLKVGKIKQSTLFF
jgi:hypothetical protein